MSASGIPVYADIEAAAARIAPYARETPLIENHALNARVGGRVLLKLETLQRTGSFKFRGALNRILQIPQARRGAGVVAFSSGNHAQGVAAAAGLLGIPAVIVMPADAPAAKLEGTRSLGAEIVFYDRQRDDREAIATGLCAERGATLVRPFDDAAVVAGQGTIGLELARQAAALGARLGHILVPCSGGGLVSGIALALSAAAPPATVHSVEPEGFDGMRRSLIAGTPTAAAGGAVSLADALMAPAPGQIPFALARRLLGEGFSVNDEELARAVSYAVRVLKLVVEPGGAAGLAALLAMRIDAGGGDVAIVLSGGNCDTATLAQCCSCVITR
ncbi:MAG: threonine/serine dehydratase [Alphaproteobacteria bacterium]|nr:threonine/serine dehydratase [Alphaproteobacteria bacterium]MBU6471252.1 threonine/serine dehydratase [Alphaproteobacteria bacterium]MDE2014069.1 threonine/serine dehydratase [Alphaproteobacteria bacterium]MDE2073095.1 threonine/serine dehydratase [Alphaproteobacteria bacterium]MDE2352104.1 threonine/serine dehydratase [Alphaproteobacteria bacterium]